MSRRASSSGLKEMWRSILLWMHWRQRAREKQRAQQAYLLSLQRKHLEQQEQMLRRVLPEVLMEALHPMAKALLRMDDLNQELHRQQMELLGEILNSLQPTVFQQLGLPSRPPSSRNSEG